MNHEQMMIMISLLLGAAAALALTFLFVAVRRNRRLRRLIRSYQEQVKTEDAGQTKKEELPILQRMVPMELYESFRESNGEEMSFESKGSMKLVNMYVNCNGFTDMIHRMDAKEVFTFINRFMNRAIPKIMEDGGVIQEFQKAGMTVMYLQDYEQALVNAISLCELFHELGRHIPEYNLFTIGIHYENTIFGVVGHPQRLSMLALSAETMEFSGWLQRKAQQYYAKILVTDSYLELIADYRKRFNIRLLGYVYIEETNSMKRFYDIFDGDDKDTRNRKRQTKLLFEKGISLFTEQNFEESRKYFIEVLKADRFDKAAREYVYQCERYIRKTPENPVVYIEKY